MVALLKLSAMHVTLFCVVSSSRIQSCARTCGGRATMLHGDVLGDTCSLILNDVPLFWPLPLKLNLNYTSTRVSPISSSSCLRAHTNAIKVMYQPSRMGQRKLNKFRRECMQTGPAYTHAAGQFPRLHALCKTTSYLPPLSRVCSSRHRDSTAMLL